MLPFDIFFVEHQVDIYWSSYQTLVSIERVFPTSPMERLSISCYDDVIFIIVIIVIIISLQFLQGKRR